MWSCYTWPDPFCTILPWSCTILHLYYFALVQYFGHLMWRTDSLEKTLLLGKIEGRRRSGWQRMRWHQWLDGHAFEQAPGVGDGKPDVLQSMGSQRVRCEWATELNWTDNNDTKIHETFHILRGLPWICLQCRSPGFNPWVGKIPWRKAW